MTETTGGSVWTAADLVLIEQRDRVLALPGVLGGERGLTGDAAVPPPGFPPTRDMPGRDNAFNGAVMHYLTEGLTGAPIAESISIVVRQALESWIRTARGTGLMTNWQAK